MLRPIETIRRLHYTLLVRGKTVGRPLRLSGALAQWVHSGGGQAVQLSCTLSAGCRQICRRGGTSPGRSIPHRGTRIGSRQAPSVTHHGQRFTSSPCQPSRAGDVFDRDAALGCGADAAVAVLPAWHAEHCGQCRLRDRNVHRLRGGRSGQCGLHPEPDGGAEKEAWSQEIGRFGRVLVEGWCPAEAGRSLPVARGAQAGGRGSAEQSLRCCLFARDGRCLRWSGAFRCPPGVSEKCPRLCPGRS